MSHRLIIEEGGVPICGSYNLSSDSRVTQYMILMSVLSAEEVRLTNASQSGVVSDLIDTIKFFGGTIQTGKDGRVTITPSRFSTLAIPAERLDQLSRGGNIDPKKNQSGSISHDDDLAFLIWSVLLAKQHQGAIPLSRDFTIEKDLGYSVKHQSGFWVGEYSGFKEDAENVKIINLKQPRTIDILRVIVLTMLQPDRKFTIQNVQVSPYISEIIEMLRTMGAEIEVTTHDSIVIKGVNELHGGKFSVPNSISEACIVGAAAALTHGDIQIQGLIKGGMVGFLSKLQQAKVNYQVENDTIRVWSDAGDRFEPIKANVRPYPGFQPEWIFPLMVLMTQLDGESELVDTFMLKDLESGINMLKAAGAETYVFEPEISTDDNYNSAQAIRVFGPTKLKNGTYAVQPFINQVSLPLLVGLTAVGITEIISADNLQRVFPDLTEKLVKIGAKIKVIDIDESQ